MSAPKLQRIIDAIATRLQGITVVGGYYSDIGENVLRDKREPHESELPAVLVWLGARTVEDTRNLRALCQQTITVEAYADFDGADPEAVGIQLLADIQRAVETGDATLGGLLRGSDYGVTFQSDEVFMPEFGESIVGAQTVYAIPHIRKSGDPEIA